MKKLKNHMKEFGQNYESKITNLAWGKTLFVIIPWSTIIDEKIGGKINENKA